MAGLGMQIVPPESPSRKSGLDSQDEEETETPTKKGGFMQRFRKNAKANSKQNFSQIEFSRSSTHRIFNLEKNPNTQLRLIRDCIFRYSVNKQGGKDYSSKYLELKIEKHMTQQEDYIDGKRIGY